MAWATSLAGNAGTGFSNRRAGRILGGIQEGSRSAFGAFTHDADAWLGAVAFARADLPWIHDSSWIPVSAL